MIVFRVSNVLALPKHWSYIDAWEIDQRFVDDDEQSVLVDNREPGAQVWSDFHVLAPCLAGGSGCDGDYSFQDYKHLLIIEAGRAYATSTEWDIVLPEDVESVAKISTKDVVRELIARYPEAFGRKKWNEPFMRLRSPESLSEAVEEDAETWSAWLRRSARKIPTRFVETLPKPKGAAYARLPVVRG